MELAFCNNHPRCARQEHGGDDVSESTEPLFSTGELLEDKAQTKLGTVDECLIIAAVRHTTVPRAIFYLNLSLEVSIPIIQSLYGYSFLNFATPFSRPFWGIGSSILSMFNSPLAEI